jgi:hypothetical protein
MRRWQGKKPRMWAAFWRKHRRTNFACLSPAQVTLWSRDFWQQVDEYKKRRAMYEESWP